MKKLIMLCIVPVFLGFRTGDEIDEKRMNRDLEIAKNILATLIKTDSEGFFGGTSIEATYIKDYGVVFTIPEHLVYFHKGTGAVLAIPEPPVLPNYDMDFKFEFKGDDDLSAKEKANIKKEMELMKEEMELSKREMKEIQKQGRKTISIIDGKPGKDVHLGSKESSEINWEEIMITFLADYADLIGQLRDGERIVINQKSPHEELFMVWDRDSQTGNGEEVAHGISAEVRRKDIAAYKTGRINRETLVERIKITKKEPHKKIPDLELFASIFDRYYSHDLSETFYSNGKPRYEVLEGFGAIFHIRATSPNAIGGRVRFYGPGNSWHREPKQKSDTGDDELYPQFKDNIKLFMLDYGRTIRSLGDGEKVVLEIKIHSCSDCEVPQTLEVSAKMSLLKQYDQQKISREKATEEIEIKEVF